MARVVRQQHNTVVRAMDEKEFNSNHHYEVCSNECSTSLTTVTFQKGPVKENGINGCTNEDLIVIVKDRLESFQQSEYACRENAIAITKLEEALMWLEARTANRIHRGVEGTNQI